MKLNEIAEEIHRDLGAPTSPSQGIIKFWLRENIGSLNCALATDYSIINHEISPELGENEKAIYKQMYIVYYYGWLIRINTGSAAFDAIVEVTSDGATVRKVANNAVVQNFIQLKKSAMDELDKLKNGYKSGGNILPKQIVGDDTEEFYSSTEEIDRE